MNDKEVLSHQQQSICIAIESWTKSIIALKFYNLCIFDWILCILLKLLQVPTQQLPRWSYLNLKPQIFACWTNSRWTLILTHQAHSCNVRTIEGSPSNSRWAVFKPECSARAVMFKRSAVHLQNISKRSHSWNVTRSSWNNKSPFEYNFERCR